MNADANLISWLMAALTAAFMIFLGFRAERRRSELVHLSQEAEKRRRELGSLETQEMRMQRRIEELEHTVTTLLTKLNEAQEEVNDLRRQLHKATARIAELEVMYEIVPQGVMRLSPKRQTKAGAKANTVPADLRTLLTERLADEDIRQIAFDMGADYETWAGDTLPVRITSTLSWYARRGQLDTLLGAIRKARPDIKIE